MLRIALNVLGGIMAAAAALLLVAGFMVVAFWLALWAAILIAGLLIERWRYKELTGRRPGPEWQATGERFVDPESGKLVEVYYHPTTGERRYIAV